MDPSDAFDSEGYFKMGDIVHYDEDNCLFLSGRIKEVFKYRTWQIFPAIVEEVLMGHPAVKDAAVLGIPHPEDTNHPLGLVVLKNGFENVTAQEIRQYADERLIDPEKLRAGVKIVDKLLRSAAGKVKRRVLVEMI
nr:unnamed protein product [Callosobruchus chinensis]